LTLVMDLNCLACRAAQRGLIIDTYWAHILCFVIPPFRPKCAFSDSCKWWPRWLENLAMVIVWNIVKPCSTSVALWGASANVLASSVFSSACGMCRTM
jgi:hypothetical protein